MYFADRVISARRIAKVRVGLDCTDSGKVRRCRGRVARMNGREEISFAEVDITKSLDTEDFTRPFELDLDNDVDGSDIRLLLQDSLLNTPVCIWQIAAAMFESDETIAELPTLTFVWMSNRTSAPDGQGQPWQGCCRGGNDIGCLL